MKKINLAAVAALALAVGLVAGPAISAGQSTVINACANKSSGLLRISKKCTKSEKQVTWNVVGASGPIGTNGSNGLQGDVGATGSRGATGSPGPAGLSAYEVAISNGFVGDEESWLESLSVDRFTVRSAYGISGAPYWKKLSPQPNPDISEITFTDLMPGYYSLDLTVSFQNQSSEYGSAICYWYDANMSGAGNNLLSKPFYRVSGITSDYFQNYSETVTNLLRIYVEGDYSLHCQSSLPTDNLYSGQFVGHIYRVGS